MPHIAVSKEVGAPAWRIWELLADFADVSWIPVAGQVDIDGDGIGMRRSIHGTGDQPVVETLTHVDKRRRELGYTVAGSPLPVDRFEALVTVREGEHPTTRCWRGTSISTRRGRRRRRSRRSKRCTR